MDIIQFNSYIAEEFLPVWKRPARRGPLVFHLEQLERRLCASVTPLVLHANLDQPLIFVPRENEPSPDVSGIVFTSRTLYADDRKAFSGVVGRFTDSKRPDALNASDYSVAITWPDGTSTAGAVTSDPKGGFLVSTTGTLGFGNYGLKLTITARAQGTTPARTSVVSSAIFIIPPAVAGRGIDVVAPAGSVFEETVAEFTGVDTSRLTTYSVRIDWGDGNSSAGRIEVVDTGAVRVVGSHAYASPDEFDVRVDLTNSYSGSTQPLRATGSDDAMVLGAWFGPFGPSAEGQSGSVRSHVVVTPGVLGGLWTLKRTISAAPVRDRVARFTVTDPGADVSDLVATIDWHDGRSPATGTIRREPDGTLSVYATEPPTEWTYEYASVTITRAGTGETVGVAYGSVQLDNPSRVTAYEIQGLVEGVAWTGIVGTIKTADLPEGWTESIDVSVTLENDITIPGTLVPRGDGVYDVRATLAPTLLGRERPTRVWIGVTQHRTDPQGAAHTSGMSSAWEDTRISRGTFFGFRLFNLLSGDLSPGIDYDFESDVVGVITTGGDTFDPSDFQATIMWDDGVTEQADVRAVQSQQGPTYEIHSTRTLQPGYYTGNLILSAGTKTQEIDVRRVVRGQRVPVEVPKFNGAVRSGDPISAFTGQEYSGVLARFTSDDPNTKASDFSATIWWGEGRSTVGTIETDPAGGFVVRGTYTFLQERLDYWDKAYVAVTQGDVSGNVQTAVHVVTDPRFINLTPTLEGELRQRESATVALGTFTSPVTGALASEFDVQIDWGDGTSSAGVVTDKFGGGFQITADKTYAKWGSFEITISVTGPGGTTQTRAVVSVIHNPVVLTPADRLPQSGRTIDGRLAGFIDDLTDRPFDWWTGQTTSYNDADADDRVLHAGLVDWGDGTIGMGTIRTNPDGTYDVEGTHTYSSPGSYEVKLIVRRTLWRLGDGWARPDTGAYDLAITNRASFTAGTNGKSDDYSFSLGTVTIPPAAGGVFFAPSSRAAPVFATTSSPITLADASKLLGDEVAVVV